MTRRQALNALLATAAGAAFPAIVTDVYAETKFSDPKAPLGEEEVRSHAGFLRQKTPPGSLSLAEKVKIEETYNGAKAAGSVVCGAFAGYVAVDYMASEPDNSL